MVVKIILWFVFILNFFWLHFYLNFICKFSVIYIYSDRFLCALYLERRHDSDAKWRCSKKKKNSFFSAISANSRNDLKAEWIQKISCLPVVFHFLIRCGQKSSFSIFYVGSADAEWSNIGKHHPYHQFFRFITMNGYWKWFLYPMSVHPNTQLFYMA